MSSESLARRTAVAALTLSGAAFAQAGGAADWPKRQPIRLVAVFPPGGSVDQVARILAPVLQQQLGQNVIVDRAPLERGAEQGAEEPDVARRLEGQGITVGGGSVDQPAPSSTSRWMSERRW